jgi:hypothetical protein
VRSRLSRGREALRRLLDMPEKADPANTAGANPCGLITEFFRALNDTHGTHHSLHDGLPC